MPSRERQGVTDEAEAGVMGHNSRKAPSPRERLPTPASWPGEFQGLKVHGVAKSRTRQSNFHVTGHQRLEEARFSLRTPCYHLLLTPPFPAEGTDFRLLLSRKDRMYSR